MLMRVVSILPALLVMDVSIKAGYPVRLILDKLTLTNSRLMESESFLPVTDVLSSSTAPNTEYITALASAHDGTITQL